MIQRSWWLAGARGQRGWPWPRRVRGTGVGGGKAPALEMADRHWNFGFASGVSLNKLLNPSQPRPPRQRGGDDSSVYLPLIQHLSRCASTSQSPASALTHTHVCAHTRTHACVHTHTHSQPRGCQDNCEGRVSGSCARPDTIPRVGWPSP